MEKTLNNNLSIISSSVEKISNQKLKIKIDNNIKESTQDKEEEHPLLGMIKKKFDGDTIR